MGRTVVVEETEVSAYIGALFATNTPFQLGLMLGLVRLNHTYTFDMMMMNNKKKKKKKKKIYLLQLFVLFSQSISFSILIK